MLCEQDVRALLAPFGLSLTAGQVEQLLNYLETLQHWNRKINLTSIRTPEECVTRHFGESLYLCKWIELRGRILDIGSGAGFPGLALKIVFPQVSVTLLEPIAKKRAFLKEVIRVCGMHSVEVQGERLEDFVRQPRIPYDMATARAVSGLCDLIPLAVQCLSSGGRLALWVSHSMASELEAHRYLVNWQQRIPVPLARERVIWCGIRQ